MRLNQTFDLIFIFSFYCKLKRHHHHLETVFKMNNYAFKISKLKPCDKTHG